MKGGGKSKVVCSPASIRQVEGYIFQMESSISVHRHSARHRQRKKERKRKKSVCKLSARKRERGRCMYSEHICKSHFSVWDGE